MSRHQFRTYAAAVFFASGLVSAGAQESVSVRLNWFAAGYTAPFYVGVEKGYYREAGLDVKVNDGQGSGPTVQQVAAGATTFGFVSSDALVRAVSRGAPVKMVASLAESNGYCVQVKADSGIKQPKDLEGKRYGSTASSSIGGLFPAYLKAAKIPEDKVRRVSIEQANLYAAFLGGQIDGMEALTFDEPARFAAKGVPVNCLPYSETGLKVLGPGIVASTATIEKNPALVQKFVAATLKAYTYSFQNPEEAAAIAKKLGGESLADEKVSVDQLKQFQQLQSKPFGGATDEAWLSSVSVLKESLKIENAPTTVSSFFTTQFLPK